LLRVARDLAATMRTTKPAARRGGQVLSLLDSISAEGSNGPRLHLAERVRRKSVRAYSGRTIVRGFSPDGRWWHIVRWWPVLVAFMVVVALAAGGMQLIADK
jgi:hypothetical protein